MTNLSKIWAFLGFFLTTSRAMLRTLSGGLRECAAALWGDDAAPLEVRLGRVNRVRLDGTIDIVFADQVAPARGIRWQSSASVDPGDLVAVMRRGEGEPVAVVAEIEGAQPAPRTPHTHNPEVN